MKPPSAKYIAYMSTRDPLTFTLVCRICKQTKPLNDYYKQEASKTCHRSECKVCTNETYSSFDENGYKRKLFTNKKSHAKQSGTDFNIGIEHITWVERCPVLGTELVYAVGGRERDTRNIPSLDRVDSTKGYIVGNVQVISMFANSVKNNITLEEAMNLVAYMQGNPIQVVSQGSLPRVQRKKGFKPRRNEVMPPAGYVEPKIDLRKASTNWSLHQ